MAISLGRRSGGAIVSRRRITFGLVATLALSSSACTAAVVSKPILDTRTSEGGQVTVTVTWDGPSAGPRFGVTMDTHAVDLDAYDLSTLAVLRVDGGREAQPDGWDAPKGGHHRKGNLSFATTTADGKPLINQTTRSVELIIRDVAGVSERRFRWDLSS